MTITRSQITKLCGRKGVNRTQLERYLNGLSGNREYDIQNIEKLIKHTPNTIKAIKDGISIYYGGVHYD